MLILVEDRRLASKAEAQQHFEALWDSGQFARVQQSGRRVKAWINVGGRTMRDCIFRNAQSRLAMCGGHMKDSIDPSEHAARRQLIETMARLLEEAGARVDLSRIDWRLMAGLDAGGK